MFPQCEEKYTGISFASEEGGGVWLLTAVEFSDDFNCPQHLRYVRILCIFLFMCMYICVCAHMCTHVYRSK